MVDDAGEVLWPARYPMAEVEELRKAVGTRAWEALYQQRPAPAEGGILKRQWWKEYRTPPACPTMLQSWDMSFKDSDGSSYVVGLYMGRYAEDVYVLDCVRDRMDFPTTCTAFEHFHAKHPRAKAKLIEDKANGPAVIATLSKKIPGIIAVLPEGSKIARVSAVSPFVESGNCHLPDPSVFPNASWVHGFVDECAIFPNGEFDDQVDAFSQGANRFFNRPRPRIITQQDLKNAQNRSNK